MTKVDNSFLDSCADCSLTKEVEAKSGDLLVCHCYNVYESTVKEVVKAGASTVSEVMQECGAGSECGACHVRIERVLRGMPAKCGSGRFDLCGQCGTICAFCSCNEESKEEAVA